MSIKIETLEVAGLAPALHGMRNPMNSWDKADSRWEWVEDDSPANFDDPEMTYVIGPNDHDLAMKLRAAGTDHRKYLRMIMVWADITAPLYWHKEMDTYRMGVEKNSCSSMHKITEKEFTRKDFSCEYLVSPCMEKFDSIIEMLNGMRLEYLNWDRTHFRIDNDSQVVDRSVIWHNLIQLLPSSYNQKRTVMMSYEALANMYHARKHHRLDEWREFCQWVEGLPNSELITGEEKA